MNYIILFNLEKKTFKRIEIYFDLKSLIVEVKEITKDNYEKIIDSKKLGSTNDFEKYLEKIKKVKSSEGFADSYNMIENINNLEFLEDDIFGYLIKESNYSANLQTTKYIEAFKTTVFLSLGTDEDFNLFDDVKNTYNFFIKKQFEIVNSLKKWFWDEFLWQFNDNIENEKSHRKFCNFDEDYNELVKLKIEDINFKDIFDNAKEKSDKFFKILEIIDKVETSDEKNAILDQVISIQSISINTITNYDNEGTIYGDIIFYFDYFLDDEHGLQIKLENGKNFELY